jgi:hypothetical protein
MEEQVELALRAALLGVGASVGVTVSGVWRALVPQDKTLPAIVFQVQSAIDVDTHQGRAWIDARYLVKAVTVGYDDADSILLAAGIDEVLNHKRIEGAGVRLEDVRRVAPFSSTETRDGKVYRHRGGSYRIMIVFE